ncbi:Crp/Fnr family transcriptional regulator [Dinoroseobacter sp. S375]|uniref:Crp/Fnr family transcriptional regulator n=1 Tax=Dinoroseobacter sp. S375 TaxID=3415136 RepID=UPI003C7D426F
MQAKPLPPLPDTGFLADTSPELRQLLESLAQERVMEDDETLFEQGDPGDALFAVVEGIIEISVLSPDGRKLVLDIMRPGALLGEIALFDPGVRTATAIAVGPTRLRRLKNADLMNAIRKSPDMAVDLIHLAGRRMRSMSAQIEDQAFLPLSTRLARKLLYLTEANPEGELFLSQAQLAEFVGATREAVSKTLGEWKRARVIEANRGALRILERGAMRALAEPNQL